MEFRSLGAGSTESRWVADVSMRCSKSRGVCGMPGRANESAIVIARRVPAVREEAQPVRRRRRRVLACTVFFVRIIPRRHSRLERARPGANPRDAGILVPSIVAHDCRLAVHAIPHLLAVPRLVDGAHAEARPVPRGAPRLRAALRDGGEVRAEAVRVQQVRERRQLPVPVVPEVVVLVVAVEARVEGLGRRGACVGIEPRVERFRRGGRDGVGVWWRRGRIFHCNISIDHRGGGMCVCVRWR
ncbi:hypothetical protein GGX14DRAFT_454868 [Mycena pura]|uniref:Uncharacterized protein n=1 Tax=Mycena pura TaxID=153505 RepID=A0AAD6VEY9_9AGAR|nr:hypothetical protein GGX14DRAFT_454868 [Mycena pura]